MAALQAKVTRLVLTSGVRRSMAGAAEAENRPSVDGGEVTHMFSV